LGVKSEPCSKCGKNNRIASIVTIPNPFKGTSTEVFYCDECIRSKVGIDAECDVCHKVKLIYYQDECFNHTECKACFDKRIAHLKAAEVYYKEMEQGMIDGR
jgi:hypothetical protein